MRILKPEIAAFANLFKLEMKNFYLGVSNGNFVTRYPHPRLVFCLNCDDGSFMDDGHSTVFLKRGLWLLLPPFIEISHQHCRSRQVSIHFSYSLLRGMELLGGLDSIRYAEAPELLPLAEAMQSSQDDPVHFLNAANLLIRSVLYQIIQQPGFDLCPMSNSKLLIYTRLTNHLYRQLDPHIKVAEMAAIMNMGEQSFARKFVADTGLTPRKFNENIIIDHAVELLENSRLSIKEIAEKLHFSNEYYFSRFFRRCMKMPPGSFRKKMSH